MGLCYPSARYGEILVIAFVIAIGMTMMLQIDFSVRLGRDGSRNIPLSTFIKDNHVLTSIIVASLSLSLYTFASIMTARGMGITLKNVAAITIGAGIGVPAVVAVSRVKDSLVPVAPVRAIMSSLIFVGLLAILFPSAAGSFISEFENTGPLVLATVAFNIFGDAVSLVETRWALRLSRGMPFFAIIAIIVLDIILSGIIYLLLPGISNVNWNNLVSAVQFQGPKSWMGILFWSTFLTSLFFYLFVTSILLLRILTPIARLFNKLDDWFALYRYPVRLTTISMVIIETVAFGVYAFMRIQ